MPDAVFVTMEEFYRSPSKRSCERKCCLETISQTDLPRNHEITKKKSKGLLLRVFVASWPKALNETRSSVARGTSCGSVPRARGLSRCPCPAARGPKPARADSAREASAGARPPGRTWV